MTRLRAPIVGALFFLCLVMVGAHVNYDITHENVLMLVGPRGRVRVIHPEADAVSKWQLLHEVDAILGRTG